MTDGNMVSTNTASRHPYRVITLSALGASLLLGVFRSIILNKYIDPNTELYNNAAVGTVFFILLAVLVAACLGTYFFAVKHPVERPVRNEAVTTAFSATMCGMSFATVAVATLISELRTHAALDALKQHRFADPILFVIELLLIVLSSAYFWHICITGTKAKAGSDKETILPIFPALSLGVRVVRLFIDKEHQINASERSFLLLTLVMLMMFFISEARFSVSSRPGDDKDTAAKRFARYFVFALISTVLTVCILLPHSIMAAFSISSSEYLIGYVLSLCLGLHAALRILSY